MPGSAKNADEQYFVTKPVPDTQGVTSVKNEITVEAAKPDKLRDRRWLGATPRQPAAKTRPIERSITMGGRTDIVKGRIEEAASALTGNDRLRNQGETDRAVLTVVRICHHITFLE